MKISELIELLEPIKKESGDWEVIVQDSTIYLWDKKQLVLKEGRINEDDFSWREA